MEVRMRSFILAGVLTLAAVSPVVAAPPQVSCATDGHMLTGSGWKRDVFVYVSFFTADGYISGADTWGNADRSGNLNIALEPVAPSGTEVTAHVSAWSPSRDTYCSFTAP
jgi:hypothetical protein